MPNDSTKKTLIVALCVCLVCSILVSTAFVVLRSLQAENQRRERLKNILEAGEIMTDRTDIETVYRERILAFAVDLRSGKVLPNDETPGPLEPDRFDIKAVAGNPQYSRPIPAKEDLAGIVRMPTHVVVYGVKDSAGIGRYILPLYGKGLWSTMYGFIALDRDLVTIRGFTFYEHGETPGLGGEIDNPRWKKLWVGKQAFDPEGKVRIRVLKGRADPNDADARYQVDGLSGSTLTTRGVDQTVRFWLGENGYGPFLERLRSGS